MALRLANVLALEASAWSSSLAVAAAARLGVTVAAFVGGDSYNLYSHPERIAWPD